MRKLLALAASASVATVTIGALSAAPVLAQCPQGDGTVPGTPARAIAVGPFYVDDRDFADVDDDGNAGGLWIYMESNTIAGLQRGGDQIAFTVLTGAGVNPNVPYIPQVDLPTGGALFPGGFGGGSISEEAGSHDDCDINKPGAKDSIVF